MQYRNNETGEIVTAYSIGEVIQATDNYAISLPEICTQIGLYPAQTANYIPVPGDFYIDRGIIIDSEVIDQTDFLSNYTEVQ